MPFVIYLELQHITKLPSHRYQPWLPIPNSLQTLHGITNNITL